jgi:hypothetical protein
LKGASESYADSRFSRKQRLGSGFSLGKTGGAYHAGGLGSAEDSWVEEASLVLYSLSDREGFGGPDHTMGGQSAKRTTNRDVVADSREAGAGTGDRYGKGPR